LAYHRARWMDPGRGRFVSADSWHGEIDSPATLHRYAYVLNNPANLVDPSGLSTIFTDWGNEVHDKIGDHFQETYGTCATVNRSIGTILETGGMPNRPDLVNTCTHCVYEIKTVLGFAAGTLQLQGYIDSLNRLDPSANVLPWRFGDEYEPPPVLELGTGSFAFINPPLMGVITYEVVDFRLMTLLVLSASAADMTASMSGALAMASLGVVM